MGEYFEAGRARRWPAKIQRIIEKKQALAEAEQKAAEDKFYAIKDNEEQKALNRKKQRDIRKESEKLRCDQKLEKYKEDDDDIETIDKKNQQRSKLVSGNLNSLSENLEKMRVKNITNPNHDDLGIINLNDQFSESYKSFNDYVKAKIDWYKSEYDTLNRSRIQQKMFKDYQQMYGNKT